MRAVLILRHGRVAPLPRRQTGVPPRSSGFELRPQFPDALSARGGVFVEDFTALADAFIQVEVGDLLGEAALDVFDAEAAGGGVVGGDDVEDAVVGG